MQRRSKRLQEKAEGRSEDEEKTDRRLSAADVLGMNVPADSKDLEHAQTLSAAEAAAARLDSYRKAKRDEDDEAKEERNVANARQGGFDSHTVGAHVHSPEGVKLAEDLF